MTWHNDILHTRGDSADSEGEEAYESSDVDEVDKGIDSSIHIDIV